MCFERSTVSSTFALDHFDLFGLRQGLKMGNLLKIPGSDDFVTLFHYKLVRHPIMTGFFIMFWSTPVMTQGIKFTMRSSADRLRRSADEVRSQEAS